MRKNTKKRDSKRKASKRKEIMLDKEIEANFRVSRNLSRVWAEAIQAQMNSPIAASRFCDVKYVAPKRNRIAEMKDYFRSQAIKFLKYLLEKLGCYDCDHDYED